MNTTYIIASLVLLIAFSMYQRSKVAKNKIAKVIPANCVVCKQCIKRCKAKAIDIEGEGNEKRIVINPDKCTACKKCITVCKFNAMELAIRKQETNPS